MTSPPATAQSPRRPRISRAFLEDYRRRLCVDAAAELFHEFGREGPSVINIVRLAGTSRNSFYDVFRSVDDCIAYGIGVAVDELFATLAAQDGEGEWTADAHDAIVDFYGAVAANPILAELFLVHSGACGVEHGRSAAQAGFERFTLLFGRGRGEAERRGRRPPPLLADEYFSRAVVSLAARRVAGPGVVSLPEEGRSIAAMVVGSYLGSEETDRILGGPVEQLARS